MNLLNALELIPDPGAVATIPSIAPRDNAAIC